MISGLDLKYRNGTPLVMSGHYEMTQPTENLGPLT